MLEIKLYLNAFFVNFFNGSVAVTSHIIKYKNTYNIRRVHCLQRVKRGTASIINIQRIPIVRAAGCILYWRVCSYVNIKCINASHAAAAICEIIFTSLHSACEHDLSTELATRQQSTTAKRACY